MKLGDKIWVTFGVPVYPKSAERGHGSMQTSFLEITIQFYSTLPAFLTWKSDFLDSSVVQLWFALTITILYTDNLESENMKEHLDILVAPKTGKTLLWH